MSKTCIRVVRAFIACGSLTLEEVSFKAGVAQETARKICRDLLEEGLVEKSRPSHAFVFRWKGRR